jgi:hypothetical protein
VDPGLGEDHRGWYITRLRARTGAAISSLVVVAWADQYPIAGMRGVDGGLDRAELTADSVVLADPEDSCYRRRRGDADDGRARG